MYHVHIVLMGSKITTYSLLLLFAALGAAVVFALVNGNRGTTPAEISQVNTGSSAPIPTDGPDEGDPAPEFEVETLGGETFSMADQRGQVVVVNFWATWCAPCRIEIPDLVEMQTELGDRGVRFVGISVDLDSDDVILDFAEQAGITYPIIVDDGSISEKFGGIFALPTTFVIDREGIIRRRKAGIESRETLMPVLEDVSGI